MSVTATNVETLVSDMVSSIPTVYFKLKKAIDDPMSSFKDFENIIRMDSGLIVRLLKVVNSPYYGLTERVETIERALTIVGIGQLCELVLTTSIAGQFKGLPKELVDMGVFWRNSIGCGLAAKMIALYKKKPNPEAFYTAGMLHDIGSLVIFKKKPDQAREVFTICKNQKTPLTDTERKVLGFDHTQAGGALLKAWKLPQFLYEVVLWHHDPFKSTTHRSDAGIIHVADFVSYQLNAALSGGTPPPPLNVAVVKELGLSEQFLVTLEKELKEPIEKAVSAFM